MQVSTKFRFLLLSVALFLSMAFAACGANSSNGGSSNTTSAIKIAFLMPCSTCADRFEKQDKPLFIQAVKALDPSIQVIADNAQGSSATQLAQTEAALTNGANVIVISPLDSATGVAVVGKASAQHVPVVSYDGLLTGARVDYYVSFPNEQVGELQGQFLLAHVKPGGTIVMINGSQDIDPGREFKAGAHKVLDPAFASGRLKLGFEADIHQFDPSKAQAAMEQALTKLNNKVDGVLVANDGMAGGVIAALTEQKLNGKVLVTGQDATDTGLQRILVGDQTMTVYKAIKQEATYAAKIAVNLAKGDRASANSLATTTVNNGAMEVPSVLLTPVVVTKDNIFSTVIADGFTTRARICVGAAAAQCPS
jgi:D-xylose transport system substrate-binding protein